MSVGVTDLSAGADTRSSDSHETVATMPQLFISETGELVAPTGGSETGAVGALSSLDGSLAITTGSKVGDTIVAGNDKLCSSEHCVVGAST